MGFGKGRATKEQIKKVERERFRAADSELGQRLADIERAGRKRKKLERLEKEREDSRRKPVQGKRTRDPETLLEMLRKNQPVHILRSRLFEALVEFGEENKADMPAFRAYEKDRHKACAQFAFDMQRLIARLSWIQLAKVIAAATEVPVPIRDWSEAFHHVLNIVMQTLGIADYHGTGGKCDIDQRALDSWPIDPKLRLTKREEEIMSKQQFDAVKNAKMSASAREDDDADADEDEDEEEEEGEEEDEEEDEKPAKKAKAKAKPKKAPADDDEDEEPAPKKAKKSKKTAADDDEDDEPPAKSKKKASKKASDDKPAKKKREAKPSITASTKFVRVNARDKGGVKTKVLNLIPKKGGLNIPQIAKAMKDAELKGDATKIVPFLAQYKYIKVAE